MRGLRYVISLGVSVCVCVWCVCVCVRARAGVCVRTKHFCILASQGYDYSPQIVVKDF